MTYTFEIDSAQNALQASNMIEILQWRAHNEPDRLSYTFLVDGEATETNLTYGELNRLARTVGAKLHHMGAMGERALLIYPPGLEFITALLGCLYAGVVAVPVAPPRPHRPLESIQNITADSQATIALTTSFHRDKLVKVFAEYPQLRHLNWIATDSIERNGALEWRPPSLDNNALALLQYTSGSTAAPKGVMVSHANILHNQRLIQHAFKQSPHSVIVSWLPHYHDMGLIGAIIQPLFVGAHCALMAPTAFLQRPIRWLQAISRYYATTSGAPNFAYDLCVRRISNDQLATLNLRSWQVAFNGAEPIRAESLERFVEAFASAGFRKEAITPCYGLAEATLLVAACAAERPPRIQDFSVNALQQRQVVPGDQYDRQVDPLQRTKTRALVSCGQIHPTSEVIIADPRKLTRCASNEIGEIWIKSSSVAQGYWRRSLDTIETFCARLADNNEGPYLRTGDLGFIANGELYITGRCKDVIVMRGRNHYPQDIELTVECSGDGLRPGGSAAFSVDDRGIERLTVVQEVDRSYEHKAASIIGRIRAAVADAHEIEVAEVVLVKAGGVPKTSSGKVRRHLCRRQFQEQTLAGIIQKWSIADGAVDEISTREDESICEIDRVFTPNVETIEQWLRREIARRLGIKIEEIGLDAPLARYGVDSLTALELGHALEQRLRVAMPLAIWMSSPGIARLAAEAHKLMQTTQFDAQTSNAGELSSIFELPLSYGQLALWYAQQVATESSAHNLACAARISSNLDVNAFRRAIEALVDRHAALRTTMVVRQGEPVQTIARFSEVDFVEEDASSWSGAKLEDRLNEEAYVPFNLEQRPPLRFKLWKLSSGEYILLVAAHHIIADFWSLTTIIRELGVLYASEIAPGGPPLKPLLSHYGDYVNWQRRLVESEEGERHWSYWREELDGELPLLNLPTDRPRPPVQTSRGKSETFHFNAELTERLKTLSKQRHATLYLTMLSAFLVLLHRYTGQDDILVSSPTSGRNNAEWAGLVGYFVNPVVIRARGPWHSTFTDFLEGVSKRSRAAFEHQDYPFALLIECLPGRRDMSRAPVAQGMIVMQKAPWGADQNITALALNEAGTKVDLGALSLETIALERQVSQFDLTLMIAERAGELRGSLKYNSDLFDASTIKRVLGQFRVLVEGIADDPEGLISQLSLLKGLERRQMLSEWNQTQVEFPQEETICQIFEQQVRVTPDSIAVEDEHAQITYAQLNERASQLALHLQSLSVRQETRVGVFLERSIEMLVAVMGILKSGGAYAPLDPAHPKDRSAYMLRDSEINVLLTQSSLAETLSEFVSQIVCLDTEWSLPAHHWDNNPVHQLTPESLAYIYYTSGSTGRPKGIMIQHRSVLNLSAALHQAIYSRCGDAALRIGMNSPLAFDSSVKQLVMLLSGNCVHIIPEEVRRDGGSLLSYIQRMRLDVIDCTPSHLEMLIRAGLLQKTRETPLIFLIGGEPISERLWQNLAAAPEATFFNVYGPTECTVDATACKISSEIPRSVVGRPLANIQIYLLDAGLQPVPIGVPGELHISGLGLARGYLNLPELTSEKFIPNPFSEEPGARLYKTGDLAHYLLDGNIRVLGRIGRQVKIRGFRIELEEIEATLRKCEFVEDAAVVINEHEISGKRLVAYIALEKTQPLPINEIQSFLKKHLPDYMTPSAFVSLDHLPLTSNGKLNYNALPTLEEFRSPLDGGGFVAPRTLVEERLAGMWAQSLGLAEVGIFDNFFELGGHSLMATQLISPLQDAFPTEVPLLSLFFENPTVAGLAEALVQCHDGIDGSEDIVQTLQNIRQLMEEDPGSLPLSE